MMELRVELEKDELIEKDSLRIPPAMMTKSPVKDMIGMFEEKNIENVRTVETCGNMNDVKFENSSLKLLVDKYESMNGQNESDMSRARNTTSNRPECAMGQTVGMIKKKVWGVKKNDLYGWTVVLVNKQTSENIHTKKTNAQPTSNQELKSNPQQTNFKNWLVTPKQKEGGVGG
jgi:hypothetical protein